jgi:hypothetical protein
MPNPLLNLLEHELEQLAEALAPKIIASLEKRGVIPASVAPIVDTVVAAVEAGATATTTTTTTVSPAPGLPAASAEEQHTPQSP